MHFSLSWRWPRWCTLRIPLGAALRFSVPQGGAILVRLASSTHDYIGSPRLEPGSLLPRLGFHPTSEGYSVGNLGKWLSIGSPQCPACCCTVGALFVALCGARPRPSLEGTLHVARPLVGFGVKYTGLAPRPCCLARPLHWQPCLHQLGVGSKQPWPPFASVWPNASVACSNPSLLLGNRPTLSPNPRLHPPGCALHSTHGAFVPRLRCPSRRLAACPIRALPWPVRPLLAWRASHHWADFFGPLSCAAVLRRKTLLFGLCEIPISGYSSCPILPYISPSHRLLGCQLLSPFASLLSHLCLLLLHATHG
ncbi:hypothetical protein V6N11_021606 [Hibiscus sabdariffa]|uniref:Uncharacterized protein n=2 Tax=Hibiscus sabdariffa TaxID=183260 RepID=A0ABR2AI27_9ROSI